MDKSIVGKWDAPNRRFAFDPSVRLEANSASFQLFKNVDGKKGPVVAKYHRQHSGFMGVHDKTVASLDIFGDLSEPLLDMIVVTFVYMETARAKRERASCAESRKPGVSVTRVTFTVRWNLASGRLERRVTHSRWL